MNLVKTFIKVMKYGERFSRKYEAEILAGFGMAGLLASVGLTVDSTVKAVKEVEKVEEEKGEKLDTMETIKVSAKHYVKPAISTTFSFLCMLGSVKTNMRIKSGLIAGYQLLEDRFSRYEEAVVDTVGETKEKKIKQKAMEEEIKRNPPKDNQVYTNIDPNLIWCYESISGRYFKISEGDLMKAEIELNNDIRNYDYASLSSIFTRFGLESTNLGYELGWSSNDHRMVKFDTTDTKTLPGRAVPCTIIDYTPRPYPDYNYFG